MYAHVCVNTLKRLNKKTHTCVTGVTSGIPEVCAFLLSLHISIFFVFCFLHNVRVLLPFFSYLKDSKLATKPPACDLQGVNTPGQRRESPLGGSRLPAFSGRAEHLCMHRSTTVLLPTQKNRCSELPSHGLNGFLSS